MNSDIRAESRPARARLLVREGKYGASDVYEVVIDGVMVYQGTSISLAQHLVNTEDRIDRLKADLDEARQALATYRSAVNTVRHDYKVPMKKEEKRDMSASTSDYSYKKSTTTRHFLRIALDEMAEIIFVRTGVKPPPGASVVVDYNEDRGCHEIFYSWTETEK